MSLSYKNTHLHSNLMSQVFSFRMLGGSASRFFCCLLSVALHSALSREFHPGGPGRYIQTGLSQKSRWLLCTKHFKCLIAFPKQLLKRAWAQLVCAEASSRRGGVAARLPLINQPVESTWRGAQRCSFQIREKDCIMSEHYQSKNWTHNLKFSEQFSLVTSSMVI